MMRSRIARTLPKPCSLLLLFLLPLLPLLLATTAAAQEAAPAQDPPPQQDLPSPQRLIARYLEASGGEKAIRATESMYTKGVMEMAAMGMSGALEISAKAPNKMVMRVELPGVGAILTGFDGEVAWMDNPMTGAMLLEGDQLDELMKQADFYTDLRYDELYPTQETLELADFAGQPAYKLRLVDADGKETFEYFAADSGLKIGFEGEQTTEMGKVFVTTELRDYQDIEGRMVPMTTVAKMMGMEMKMVFEEVRFNEVDDTLFALPDNIKTLVAAQEQ